MSQQVRAISMKSDDLSLTPKIHMMGEQTQVVPDLYIYTMLSPTYTIVKFFKEPHWTDLHIPEGERVLPLPGSPHVYAQASSAEVVILYLTRADGFHTSGRYTLPIRKQTKRW